MDTNNDKMRLVWSAIICTAIFFIVFFLFKWDLLIPFDNHFGDWVRSFRTETLNSWMMGVTQLGTACGLIGALIVVVFYYGLIQRNYLNSFILFVSLVGSWVLNGVIKEIVCRPRPPLPLRLIQETEWSFPSGHAMITLTFYGMLFYLIWREVAALKKITVLWFSFIGIVMFWVGVSRIYLGVHYPSDILAGFSLGLACLFGCILLYEDLLKKDHTLLKP